MPDRPPHPGPHHQGPSGPQPPSAGDPGSGQRVQRTDGQDQPRYRSLRDLSYGGRPGPDRPAASQTWQSQRTAGSSPGAVIPAESGLATPPTVGPDASEAAPRDRRGRRLLIATTSLVLVIALLVGGYYAYRTYAPWLGWGYAPGGTAAINGVAFTVVDAECGLSQAPLTGARPSKAQFCTVDLNAENQVDSNRYLVLSLFSVNLNSGLQADPSSTAMQTLSVKLAPGESKDLQLVYDVWDGVQMTEVQVQIGYETDLIRLV